MVTGGSLLFNILSYNEPSTTTSSPKTLLFNILSYNEPSSTTSSLIRQDIKQ
jgi:hypothetical protein